MSYYRAAASPRPAFAGLLVIVYLVAGGVISATHHYWSNPDSAKRVVSALLAILLWPLILLGIDLHID